ncbi:NAD-dependent epimerase/dehydratase family protein [Carboxylicivirga caseinilyticus]|uniref:NAD-dependent epimerase/dehydratase family protein n=1 Tax=Carboxylicivirga caseinilyticus TaxID=3417572 RepID=UPI003D3437A0|nr:NAD-dependent epimerase/dehydratase family protein [Marinilabiliaceae bacterium A049]
MDTILVTGGTGYVGSWIVKGLLDKAYTVRLTVRDKNNEAKYENLRQIALTTKGKLEIWEADLLEEGSFDDAALGCDAIIHVASPFTLRFKDAQRDLIDPAIKGTRNVLFAASKAGTVKKVVLTSSVAAIHGDTIDMQEQGLDEFTEEQFNGSSSLTHQPYSFSKVSAEKEAWKIAESQDEWKLFVINPSFVMGPSLSSLSDSESLSFMKDILSGKFAMGAPAIMFGFVDVRDVAKAHILALENEKSEGRHLLAERTIDVLDYIKLIEKAFPGKFKLPTKHAAKFLLLMTGWMFKLSSKFIKRNVGFPLSLNSTKSREALGLEYIPLEQTVKDMVVQMLDDKLI